MAKEKKIVRASAVKEVVYEQTITEHQACNEFQLVGTTRVHILKKYKGQLKTKAGWEEILRGERLI